MSGAGIADVVWRHGRRGLRARLGAMARVLIVAVLASGCESSGSSNVSSMSAPAAACASRDVSDASGSSYPLRATPELRHLLDASGRPFLITGDTAWSLIVQLRDTDVDRYLDDRKARGFNAILVNLIESTYGTRAPANIYGDRPFVRPGDFATPNEAYFAHADSVIRKASDRGLLVLLAPAYFGYSNDGWYDAIRMSGRSGMEAYGRYLGRRYGSCTNVMWVIGGDRTPAEPALGDALARGIKATAPEHLITAHADSDARVDRIWGGYPWLDLSTVFTYGDVWTAVLASQEQLRKPVILIESAYENDGFNPQTPVRIRAQAYHALLAGATGQVFGNNPLWHFDGPGCCSPHHFPTTWQQALGMEGSRSMAVLASIFSRYHWHTLIPDTTSAFAQGNVRQGLDRVAGAVAADRSFGIVYIPSTRTVTLDVDRLRGPADLIWIDPTNGTEHRGDQYVRGTMPVATPGRNSTGGDDWLLVVRTRPVRPARNAPPGESYREPPSGTSELSIRSNV